jgi:uncharacterized protein (TIGR02391 family)
MFRELINEAKRLLVRLEAEYKPESSDAPITDRLSTAELDGWYSGVKELLLEQFGEQSTEYALWRRGIARAEADADKDLRHPRGGRWTIHNLLVSIETLEQLRLLELKSANSDPSTLPFSALHPKIIESCERLFTSQAFDDAVLAAFRAVEEAVRVRSGAAPDAHGLKLVTDAMKGGEAAKLRFSQIEAEQEAYHLLFRGAIGAFKNPASHRTVGHANATEVLELLAFASALLRALDKLAKVH